MAKLKIATTDDAKQYFTTNRKLVDVHDTDFVDVSAVVIDEDDIDVLESVRKTEFGIPVFIETKNPDAVDAKILSQIYQLIDTNDKYDQNLVNRSTDHAATKYESKTLPPFFKELQSYVRDLLVRNI